MPASDAGSILKVHELSKRFGGLVALDNVSFEVGRAEILGLIGPNGAGKTTCFNAICGSFPATGGEVWLRGEQVRGLRASEIARRGMVRTFQSTILFREETVRENVLRGTLIQRQGNLRGIRSLIGTVKPPSAVMNRIEEIMAVLGLTRVADERAGALPYGLQKRLGVAIGLATEPDLLLLDEPAAGLNPEESVAMAALIRSLRDQRGVSVLLVEHDMKLIMGICDRIVVLENGKQIAAGTPGEVRSNPHVIRAYLGAELVN